MPITIGYEPVGAIGRAAGVAGRAQGQRDRRQDDLQEAQHVAGVQEANARLQLQQQQMALQEQARQQALVADLYKFNVGTQAGLYSDQQRMQYGAGMDAQNFAQQQALAQQQAQLQQEQFDYQFSTKQKAEFSKYQNGIDWANQQRTSGNMTDEQANELIGLYKAQAAGINPQAVLKTKPPPSIEEEMQSRVKTGADGTYIMQPDGSIDFRPPAKAEAPGAVSLGDWQKAWAQAAKSLEQSDPDGNVIPADPAEVERQAARIMDSFQSRYAGGGGAMPQGAAPMPRPQGPIPGPAPAPGGIPALDPRAVQQAAQAAAPGAGGPRSSDQIADEVGLLRRAEEAGISPERYRIIEEEVKRGLPYGTLDRQAAEAAQRQPAATPERRPAYQPSKKEIAAESAKVREELTVDVDDGKGNITKKRPTEAEVDRIVKERFEGLDNRTRLVREYNRPPTGEPQGPQAPSFWDQMAERAAPPPKAQAQLEQLAKAPDPRLAQAAVVVQALLARGSFANLAPEEQRAFAEAAALIKAAQQGASKTRGR